jgi:hypothetical protein
MPNHISAKIPQRIADALEDAYVKRVRAEQKHSMRSGVEAVKSTCAKNAWALSNKLQFAGLNPFIVWGAIDSENRNLPLETIDQLEASKRTHFWVELSPDVVNDNPEYKPIALDISAATGEYANELYAGLGTPPRYRTMSEMPSHIQFSRGFRSGALTSSLSYRRLREQSPDLFEMNPWEANASASTTSAPQEVGQ